VRSPVLWDRIVRTMTENGPESNSPSAGDGRLARRGIAYFVPWTPLLLVLMYILSFFLGQIETVRVSNSGLRFSRPLLLPDYCQELFAAGMVVYLFCALPPVVIYRFFRGTRRRVAYAIHSLWFIVADCLMFRRFVDHSGSNGTLVTPHDIITIRFGLLWSGVAGVYASDLLFVSVLVGAIYFCEKRLKERSRLAIDLKGQAATYSASAPG
jgi:hypothetical protein